MVFQCGAASIVRRSGDVEHVCVFRCKRADRECCADWYRGRLIAKIVGGKPTHHLVLTIRWLPGDDADKAARQLKDAWQSFKLWWNRRNPKKKVVCLETWEAAPNGRPHLHLAVRTKFLPVKPLRAWMRHKIGSPELKIKPIPDGRAAAGYITKYIGKGADKFRGLARYSCTRDWDQREKPQDPVPELAGVRSELIDERPVAYVHRHLSQNWRIDPACRYGTVIRRQFSVAQAQAP